MGTLCFDRTTHKQMYYSYMDHAMNHMNFPFLFLFFFFSVIHQNVQRRRNESSSFQCSEGVGVTDQTGCKCVLIIQSKQKADTGQQVCYLKSKLLSTVIAQEKKKMQFIKLLLTCVLSHYIGYMSQGNQQPIIELSANA